MRREMRHPSEPRHAAFAVAMQEHYGLGLRPRRRELIDLVVQIEVLGYLKMRHEVEAPSPQRNDTLDLLVVLPGCPLRLARLTRSSASRPRSFSSTARIRSACTARADRVFLPPAPHPRSRAAA